MYRSCCLAVTLLAFGPPGASPAADPTVSRAYLGAEAGTVVRVAPGVITVKVPRVVRSGVTRRRVGGRRGRTIAVPRYATKQVEASFSLAADVVVKTTAGTTAALGDVRAGSAVRLHGYRVTERSPGERPVSRVEVRRIDIPASAVAK